MKSFQPESSSLHFKSLFILQPHQSCTAMSLTLDSVSSIFHNSANIFLEPPQLTLTDQIRTLCGPALFSDDLMEHFVSQVHDVYIDALSRLNSGEDVYKQCGDAYEHNEQGLLRWIFDVVKTYMVAQHSPSEPSTNESADRPASPVLNEDLSSFDMDHDAAFNMDPDFSLVPYKQFMLPSITSSPGTPKRNLHYISDSLQDYSHESMEIGTNELIDAADQALLSDFPTTNPVPGFYDSIGTPRSSAFYQKSYQVESESANNESFNKVQETFMDNSPDTESLSTPFRFEAQFNKLNDEDSGSDDDLSFPGNFLTDDHTNLHSEVMSAIKKVNRNVRKTRKALERISSSDLDTKKSSSSRRSKTNSDRHASSCSSVSSATASDGESQDSETLPRNTRKGCVRYHPSDVAVLETAWNRALEENRRLNKDDPYPAPPTAAQIEVLAQQAGKDVLSTRKWWSNRNYRVRSKNGAVATRSYSTSRISTPRPKSSSGFQSKPPPFYKHKLTIGEY